MVISVEEANKKAANYINEVIEELESQLKIEYGGPGDEVKAFYCTEHQFNDPQLNLIKKEFNDAGWAIYWETKETSSFWDEGLSKYTYKFTIKEKNNVRD